MGEIEKILEEEEIDAPEDSLEKPDPEERSEDKPDESASKNEDDEIKKKEEQLANVNKAIAESNDELRKIRLKSKKLRSGDAEGDDEDDIPAINDDDPSAKAWNKRIRENVSPIQADMEKSREEVRTLALKRFLADKPATAGNSEKVKALVAKYERLRESSETNVDVVVDELNQAFAALYSQDLIDAARNRRVKDAKVESLFSEPAVDSGATSYRQRDDEPSEIYSEEDKRILARWGMSPQEHSKLKKEQKAKP